MERIQTMIMTGSILLFAAGCDNNGIVRSPTNVGSSQQLFASTTCLSSITQEETRKLLTYDRRHPQAPTSVPKDRLVNQAKATYCIINNKCIYCRNQNQTLRGCIKNALANCTLKKGKIRWARCVWKRTKACTSNNCRIAANWQCLWNCYATSK